MLRYLSDYKRESVLAPLFKMLEATFDLFVPLVMADIVNVGIAAHDFHYILVRCGILLLLAIVGLACSLTAQYFSAKAAVGYSTGLRHALFEHIQTLSFSEMDTMGTSTLITRMTSDVNQVQSGLNLFLRLFLRSPFVVIGAMIMAFTVNFRAALIFVVAIPLLSVVVFGVMVITRPLYKSVQTRLDRVLGLTRENLTGVRVVRAFDKEKSEVDRFEDANELLTKMQLHVGHISALMNPLTYVIINLAIVALLYVGSIEINIGGMASGGVIALVNYMNQILVELVKLANLIVQVSKALACAGRVQAVLDTKPGMELPAELTGTVPAAKADDAVSRFHALTEQLRRTEADLSATSELMGAVVQYAKTRPVFDGYKAAKYSRKYLAEHEAELADYRAAKATMGELLGGEKLPKMAELKEKRRQLAARKKALYADYRTAQEEMRQAVAVKANIDHLLGVTDGQRKKEQER